MIRKMEIKQEAKNFESLDYNSPYTNFIQGAEWADKTMITKACKWLKLHTFMFGSVEEIDLFIETFRKAMEG